ncbi:MAG: DUF4362 domain-containing protein [Clostridia bacterium]|nr:DUF4362 domain-containing protein [Clostridia bacterium]
MKQNKAVLFSTWGKKYDKPTQEENKNGEDNSTEYSIEQAIQEGCFVITNDNKLYNKDKLDSFIKNTDINAKNRKEDKIKIVQYTKEGDPIITELSYQIKDETYLFKGEQVNKTTYVLKVDNTRDKLAAEDDRKIIIDEDIPGQFFGIGERKEGKTVHVELDLYAIIEYATKEAKQYKTIEVCSYSSDSERLENQSFYGTVIESNQGNIIVEPREGETIRKSADKISISLGKNSDVIYAIGTNVKVTYTGSIMETYPAQVNAINIEIKSAETSNVKDKTTEIATWVATYQILNIAESNDEDYLYLTLRKFQAEEVETVRVKKKLAKDVKSDKSYEFTFQYKVGTVEENIKSIFQNAELISIVETDKKGMDQRQDSIQ